ncbi:MAG: ROK family transcriptional regulator [Pseudoalteromonas spongiae]|uniref:ROK family transcriptional regulator n=1 Tax=Pseudoalteromonas TaxID=53246 RepID=UPI000C2D4308|nr:MULTISPECIES: ROK family transcriptional regulator [Pseudoalteromonas]MCF6455811.1 ROK family transcriptional regulator [Pseudoalteromonas sp. MMG024]
MKGSNAKQNKALNLRLALSQIVALGPISRVEIARNTNLTKQTITNMVETLLEHDLVSEVGIKKAEGAGKPSKMLCFNEKAAYSIAIRIMENELFVGMFKLNGDCINSLTTLFSPDELVSKATYLVNTLVNIENIDSSKVLAVGLAMQDSNNFALDAHKVAKETQVALAESLNLPVALESTASACAAYQMLFGEAQTLQSFVYVHIGNRVESSVVYNRDILLGQNGLTGALGDIFVTPETDNDTGELGRLNDFSSLNSLKAALNIDNQKHDDFLANLTADNKLLESWVNRAEEPMRIAIHTIESIFNSQTIILGGDINEWLLDTLIKQLRPYIPSIAQYGERQVIRLIKTPEVSQITQKGIATLPLYAALGFENHHILYCPTALQATPLQALIYALDA